MGKLKIMWSIFWSEKATRFYMAFFVLLIILTSNISINLLKEEYAMKSIGEKCDFEDAVYFSKSRNILPYANGGESEYAKNVKQLLDEVRENGQAVGEITYLYTYVDALEENAFLLNYDETMIQHVQLPVSEGRWFLQGGSNEAILSYGYKSKYDVGDVVGIELEGKDGKKEEVEIKIIGFLDKNNYVMNFDFSGYVDISSLVRKNESAVITNGLYTKEGEKCIFGDNSGVMIFDMSPKETGIDYEEQLMEFGSITTMKEVTESYLVNTEERFQSQAGLEIVLLILAISGLGSMNFISMYSKRREYGVYFISGMSKKTAVWMTALMNLLVVIAAFIPVFILGVMKPEIISDIDKFNILTTMGIVLFILVVTSLPFYFIMKKESIINLTRR